MHRAGRTTFLHGSPACGDVAVMAELLALSSCRTGIIQQDGSPWTSQNKGLVTLASCLVAFP